VTRNSWILGGGLLVLALAAGCESTPKQTANTEGTQLRMGHVRGASAEVLDDILKKTGLSDSNLVLEITVTLPAPAGGDKNTLPPWKGCFAGREQGLLQADDQMLVIAKTIPCHAPDARYVFNPFNRTWMLAADRNNPDGNLLWVLFNGKASDFVQEVRKAQENRQILGSLIKTPPPISETAFPIHPAVEEMRNDLAELGLSALEQHLRLQHADGRPCTPDVHVYLKPAAGR